MKTKKLITLCFALAILLIGCKKNPSANTSNTEAASEQKGKNFVVAARYTLTPEQTNNVIKAFKKSNNDLSKTQNLIDDATVKLDSSIFVIEAALNFDYDDIIDTLNIETKTDTASYVVSYDPATNEVNSADLQDAYTNIKNQISSFLNVNSRVLLVDIDAYINGNGTSVTYEAKIAQYYAPAYYCGTNITTNASPNLFAFTTLFGCSGNPTSDACTIINQRLPCRFRDLTACNYPNYGAFYTNVYSPNQNQWAPNIQAWVGLLGPVYPNPAILFCSPAITASQHCNAQHKALTPSELNTYKTNINTQLSNNIPSTPANMLLIQGWVTRHHQLLPVQNSSPYSIYWNLRATYGVKSCRTWPNN